MNIVKKLPHVALLLLSSASFAGLTPLSEADMAKANGQSGILIDSDLQLNRGQDADGTINDDIVDCDVGDASCEFALKFNGSDQWLVMYDFSGGIDIKSLKLASTTVDGTASGKSALAIGDTECASDDCAATAVLDNYGAASWGFASDYRATPAPSSNTAISLDANKPEGFWDLRMNGELTMTGGLKYFNCAGLTRNGNAVAGC